MDGYFSGEGFDVFTHTDARGCLEAIETHQIDVCLIDINMPGQDGLALTHDIRRVSNVGIILVTSKDDLVDRIVGLESGADDYVTKPFEMRELLSRVKNVIRRLQVTPGQINTTQQSHWVFDGWTLDVNKRALIAPDQEKLKLSEGEYLMLAKLVENSGQIMDRNDLMRKVRNRDWNPDDRYLDVLVVKLRQKFKTKSPEQVFISTVHGKGYLFEPEATLG